MARDIFKSLENEVLVYKNNLLGYFNVNNVYMINPEIVSNLITYPKMIESLEDDKMHCSCYINGYGSINFEIEISTNTEDITSSLYVVENVNKVNGYQIEPLRTLIAIYENNVDNDYFEKVVYAFNLIDDSTVMEQPNLEDINKSYIYTRKYYNEKMFLSESQSYNKIFKTLTDEIMAYLKRSQNEYSKEVLKLYLSKEKELKSEYLKSGRDIDYFAKYELLNMCLYDILQKDPKYKKYKQEFDKIMYLVAQNSLKEIKALNKKFLDIEKKKKTKENSADLVKVFNNKEKLTDNDKEKATNHYLFGKSALQDFEVNSMGQWRALHLRHMPKFHHLKEMERDELRANFLRLHESSRALLGSITEACSNLISNFQGTVEGLKDNLKDINLREGAEHIFKGIYNKGMSDTSTGPTAENVYKSVNLSGDSQITTPTDTQYNNNEITHEYQSNSAPPSAIDEGMGNDR